MVQATGKKRYSMEELLAIVARLRDPQTGCPWDKVQTHASIRQNFIEETYEVADAIDLADERLLCEELGDVLLQIALHTQMEAERGAFTFEDVCSGICEKLIYRHPHIFGGVQAATPDDALASWEALKRREKHRETAGDDLDSVPAALPALMRARKVAKRAADHGLSRGDARAALDALARQVDRLRQALDAPEAESGREALGEALFCAADLSRFLGCDAEEALGEATGRFVARFKAMEALAGAEDGRLSAEEQGKLQETEKQVCAEPQKAL